MVPIVRANEETLTANPSLLFLFFSKLPEVLNLEAFFSGATHHVSTEVQSVCLDTDITVT